MTKLSATRLALAGVVGFASLDSSSGTAAAPGGGDSKLTMKKIGDGYIDMPADGEDAYEFEITAAKMSSKVCGCGPCSPMLYRTVYSVRSSFSSLVIYKYVPCTGWSWWGGDTTHTRTPDIR